MKQKTRKIIFIILMIGLILLSIPLIASLYYLGSARFVGSYMTEGVKVCNSDNVLSHSAFFTIKLTGKTEHIFIPRNRTVMCHERVKVRMDIYEDLESDLAKIALGRDFKRLEKYELIL